MQKTPTFQSLFREFMKNEFNYDFEQFGAKYGIGVTTARKWFKDGTLPRLPNIDKFFNSTLTEDHKTNFALALATESYNNEVECIIQNRKCSLTLETLISCKNFPPAIKELWQDRAREVKRYLASSYREKKPLSDVLVDYLEKTKEPSFIGFISTLQQEWQVPYRKLATILNVSRGTMESWTSAIQDNAPTFPLMTETINDMLKSRFVDLKNNEIKFKFLQLAGAGERGTTIEDVQRDFSQKIAEADGFYKKAKCAINLYSKVCKIAGLPDPYISQKSGIPARRLNKHRAASNTFESMILFKPEEAFVLSKSIVIYNDILADNLAANFLSLPAFKTKAEIKQSFLDGELNLKDLTLNTRLLVARMSREDFAKSIGIEDSTLSTFENRNSRTLNDNSIILMAKKYLNLEPHELEEFSRALEKQKKFIGHSRKVIESSRSTEQRAL